MESKHKPITLSPVWNENKKGELTLRHEIWKQTRLRVGDRVSPISFIVDMRVTEMMKDE